MFRCTHCNYTVGPQNENQVELFDSIKKWINYILREHIRKGDTASYARENKVPCPQCGKHDCWENIE